MTQRAPSQRRLRSTATRSATSLASKQVTTLPVTTFYAKDADGKLDDPVQLNVPDTITVNTGSYDEDGVFTAGSGQPVSVDIHADKSAAGIAKAKHNSVEPMEAKIEFHT